jgi:DNA-binding transcriptional LysR family regulator
MKIEDIAIWEAFYGVAKHGNFSKASQALRVNLPLLSKRVAKLEDALGVRLFQRSTRVVKLTDEGKALLPLVSSILEDLSGLESYFEDKQGLSGTIRMTCVPFIAHRLLIPLLADFKKMHPHVQIEIDLSEGVLNLIESNMDMAIRIEEPEDSDLVYKKLVPNNLIFCASPKYLKNNKAPLTKPEHLRKHQLLTLGLHENCQFENGSGKLGDFLGEKAMACENGAFLTDLALHDFGVLVRSVWDVKEHLSSGALVQVLKKHPVETFGHVYAVIPSRRFLAQRVRVFMDFVVQRASTWKST